jgi:hypothetical protein
VGGGVQLTQSVVELPYELLRDLKVEGAGLRAALAPKLVGSKQIPVSPLLPNPFLADDRLAK